MKTLPGLEEDAVRFTFRLLAATWLAAMVVLGAFAYIQIARDRGRLTADLERRAWLLGEGLREAVEPVLEKAPIARLERILLKFGTPTRGIAVYDRFAGLLFATPDLAARLPPSVPFVSEPLTSPPLHH